MGRNKAEEVSRKYMDRHSKKELFLWIGLATFALALMKDEVIFKSLGWNYPEWLRIISGSIEILIGALLAVSALRSLAWRKI